MNFQFYVEKLLNSENFKKFIEKNPEAFPCSCFFVIDKEGNDNKQHFDYCILKKEKIFSFQLEENAKKIPVEVLDKKNLNKISFKHDFDFNDIEKIILEKMKEQGIKNKIQKLLFSLQNKDSKDYLLGTIFVSGLGMLKVNIDLTSMRIIDFEKKSFFDVVNVFKKDDKKED